VKQFAGKRPQTLISLTESGREQIQQHWRRLEELRDQAGKVTDAVLPLKKLALESE